MQIRFSNLVVLPYCFLPMMTKPGLVTFLFVRCNCFSAYRNALNLRPGYIRARFNLGVACQNLHSHKEAIEHFLVALNMQAQASGPKGEKSETSSAIWTNLITSIHKIGAFEELSRSVVKRDLKSLSFHFAVNI